MRLWHSHLLAGGYLLIFHHTALTIDGPFNKTIFVPSTGRSNLLVYLCLYKYRWGTPRGHRTSVLVLSAGYKPDKPYSQLVTCPLDYDHNSWTKWSLWLDHFISLVWSTYTHGSMLVAFITIVRIDLTTLCLQSGHANHLTKSPDCQLSGSSHKVTGRYYSPPQQVKTLSLSQSDKEIMYHSQRSM